MQTAPQMIPGGFAALLSKDYLHFTEISFKSPSTADLKVERLTYALNFDLRSLFNFSSIPVCSSWKSWLIPVTLGILATIIYRYLTA